jgi:CubicO group peptidase (beta-lactamase class C family)
MNSTKLNEMLQWIDSNDLAVDSISIIRNGYVVFNALPSGNYDGVGLHVVASVTKSISSALLGIAIQQGHISNVSQKVVSFFSDRVIANLSPQKQNITVEHVLTMTSGLLWDETSNPITSPLNSFNQCEQSDDWVQFVLDRPMAHEPGSDWVYNSGSSFLLSPIIQDSTNETLKDFALQFMFEPLGITNLVWAQNPQGYYQADGGLGLSCLDMAKIGYLYLNNGTWDGQQIVPSSWIAESTSTHYSFSSTSGYGYLWWTLPDINRIKE